MSDPFPNGLIPVVDASQGTNALIGQGLAVFIRGEHSGYVQQWNFDIQREIANGFAVDVAYAGSHGIGLPGTIALNQLPDEFLKLGASLAQHGPNPFLGLGRIEAL